MIGLQNRIMGTSSHYLGVKRNETKWRGLMLANHTIKQEMEHLASIQNHLIKNNTITTNVNTRTITTNRPSLLMAKGKNFISSLRVSIISKSKRRDARSLQCQTFLVMMMTNFPHLRAALPLHLIVGRSKSLGHLK